MKVLRILRRRKIKLSFIFLLLVFFIFNTYAWMRTDRNTESGSLTLNVDDWSVAFIIDDEEIQTEEYVFEIEEFYPGITPDKTTGEAIIEKRIDVYNIGEAASNLEFEITDIYLYGERIVLKQKEEAEPQTQDENGTEENEGTEQQQEIKLIPETLTQEQENAEGNMTADLFGNSTATVFDKENQSYSYYLKYPTPFKITYEHGQTYITGQNEEVTSKSFMTINLAWDDLEANNEEDTRLGNMVYQFENAKDAEGNLINEGEPALTIKAKVTAKRVFK